MTDEFWLGRVLLEKSQLDEYLNQLLNSYDKVDFGNLPVPEKLLMVKQGTVMAQYTQILGERIYMYRKRMEKQDG